MGIKKRTGKSYAKRVADINEIYDAYVKKGLSNREIWKRYVWPRFGISERTFYNMLKASLRDDLDDRKRLLQEGFLFPDLLSPDDEMRHPDYFKKSR